MPEGDSIFRAARGLHRALAGRTVIRFESVYPRLTNRVHDTPLVGRTIERVEARGKHLLIRFSGDLVLRTHLRMHGSWHVYKSGERWRRPHHDMRILIATPDIDAVAFNVPVAELEDARTIEQSDALRDLGPDPLRDDFAVADVVARLRQRGTSEIGDALLDQRALAGIGNIYKSETLFVSRINPFTRVEELDEDHLASIVTTGARLLRANVSDAGSSLGTHSGLRRTTGRLDPGARFWVYGRGGRPCRRCGTPIERSRQGPHARSTYWCPRCQPAATSASRSGRDPG